MARCAWLKWLGLIEAQAQSLDDVAKKFRAIRTEESYQWLEWELFGGLCFFKPLVECRFWQPQIQQCKGKDPMHAAFERNPDRE